MAGDRRAGPEFEPVGSYPDHDLPADLIDSGDERRWPPPGVTATAAIVIAIGAIGLFFPVLLFIGIVAWVFWPRNKARFERYGRIPLEDPPPKDPEGDDKQDR